MTRTGIVAALVTGVMAGELFHPTSFAEETSRVDFPRVVIQCQVIEVGPDGQGEAVCRPQIMTLDNQSARVFVGDHLPIIEPSKIGETGFAQDKITYEPVGVELVVTPKIRPDGKIVARVNVNVSSLEWVKGMGEEIANARAFHHDTKETTVAARSGETVTVRGPSVWKERQKETQIPWFGDLPLVGPAFHYRTTSNEKCHLRVLLTPHVARSQAEADRILAEQARKMGD
jgi:general secretion pathway protein D